MEEILKYLNVSVKRNTEAMVINSKGMENKEIPEDIDYERRATLVNSERFISKELKEYEDIVLHSKEQIESIEYEIFIKLRTIASNYVVSLQQLADMIATIDCYISLSEIAEQMKI